MAFADCRVGSQSLALARASSSAPWASIFLNRCAMRALSQLVSASSNKGVQSLSGNSGGGVSSCQLARPRPVACKTSQARCTRIGFCRSIRARVAGSRSLRRASSPSTRKILSACVRIAAGVGGISARPLVRAVKYSPVPPTMIGRTPSCISGARSRSHCPAE